MTPRIVDNRTAREHFEAVARTHGPADRLADLIAAEFGWDQPKAGKPSPKPEYWRNGVYVQLGMKANRLGETYQTISAFKASEIHRVLNRVQTGEDVAA